MARFMTRVVLHDADWADYEQLHTAMVNRGFSPTIKDDVTGILYHLPPAEYYIECLFERDAVLQVASLAANTVGRRFVVLVSPISDNAGVTWVGLEPVIPLLRLADLLALPVPTLEEKRRAALVAPIASKYNPYDNS